MTMLARTLYAEVLKLKRTLAVWMTLVSPAVVVMLQFLIIYNRPVMMAKYTNGWMAYASSTAGLWAVLMLPLFLTLETSLVANTEHAERHWKHLLCLPVPRWCIYASKFLIVAGLVVAASLALFVLTIGGGVLLNALHPESHLPFAIPMRQLLLLHAKLLAGAVLAITLHHWVGLRWQSFTVAMGFGISATVMSFVVINSERWGRWFPWSLPARVMSAPPELAMKMLFASVLGGILALVLGAWNFSRLEIG